MKHINLHLSDTAYRWYKDIPFVQALAERIGVREVRQRQLDELAAKEYSLNKSFEDCLRCVEDFEEDEWWYADEEKKLPEPEELRMQEGIARRLGYTDYM